VIAVTAVLLLVTACEGDDGATEPTPSVSEAPPPIIPSSLPPGDDCPNRASVFEQEAPEQVVEGLVDPAGGSDDRVWIALDSDGEPGCRAFLVMEGAGGVTGLAIDRADAPVGDGFPRVSGLASIDERPGAEVVVDMLAGASTEFVAIFSMGGGGLEQLTIAGDDEYGDLFPSGGSVGHLEASDCTTGPPGTVVVSLAVPQGRRYEVTRTFYLTQEGMLRRDRVERDRIRDPQDLESYQEFLGTPFGTCAPA
jgi:hypothetical protein